MKLRRAFTLMEILVATGVFSLLTGLIAAVFLLAHRYGRLYHRVSEAQRSVLVCLQKVGFDVSRSAASSVRPGLSNSDAFWMLTWQTGSDPVVEYDPKTGQPLFQRWQGYWRTPTGQIRRAELPLSGGNQVLSEVDFGAAPVAIAPFQASVSPTLMAEKVTLFRLQVEGRLGCLEVECQTQTPGNPVTRYRLRGCYRME
jgi:type II secretory pathway pseudopilin PulG